MQTIVTSKTIHSARALTRRKHRALLELAQLSAQLRRAYLQEYWDPKFASQIMGEWRFLAARRRGAWHPSRLTITQNRLALEDVLHILKAGWMRAIRKVHLDLAGASISQRDRDVVLFILADVDRIQQCLNGTPPDVSAIGTIEQVERLTPTVREMLLTARGSKPALRRENWFRLDTNLYRVFHRNPDPRFRGAWLSVTSTEKRRRINVPLAGPSLEAFRPRTHKANSRPGVLVTVDERIVFRVIERTWSEMRDRGSEIGVDQGYKSLLTVSSGDPHTARIYGANAFQRFASVADRRDDALKNRNRIRAYERSLRNTNQMRARRIRRNNLSYRKRSRWNRQDRSHTRTSVRRVVNALFRDFPTLAVVHVEGLAFRTRRLSRAMNRRIGHWVPGFTYRTLSRKALLHGVQLNVVNAAYTSLAARGVGIRLRRTDSATAFCAARADTQALRMRWRRPTCFDGEVTGSSRAACELLKCCRSLMHVGERR